MCEYQKCDDCLVAAARAVGRFFRSFRRLASEPVGNKTLSID